MRPDGEKDFVFYISMATGSDVPGGADYIFAQNAQEEEVQDQGAEDIKEQASSEKPVQNIQAVKEEETKPAQKEPAVTEPVKTPAEPQKIQTINGEPVAEEKTEAKPEAVTGPALVGDDKLSYDYIQKLLDRIYELEEGDPDLNKAEINALNAELDAILAILNNQ